MSALGLACECTICTMQRSQFATLVVCLYIGTKSVITYRGESCVANSPPLVVVFVYSHD